MAPRRPKLRVIAGGQPGTRGREVDVDRELAAIGRQLSRLGDVLRVEQPNDEAFEAVLKAAAEVHMARLAVMHGRRK